MSSIKLGCGGFPVGRAQYFRRFPTVEIGSSFFNLPKIATAENWKNDAPAGFEFSLKAWQLITHPPSSPTYEKLTGKIEQKGLDRCGFFKPTDEVARAWNKTAEVARALGASFIIFQTPGAFYANANHLRDLYRFFKDAERGPWSFVWEPRGEWDDALIKKVCSDLDLIHGVDPLVRPSLRGRVHYYRLHGRQDGRKTSHGYEYTEGDFSKIFDACQGKTAYLYFNNMKMYWDALKFQKVMEDVRPVRRS